MVPGIKETQWKDVQTGHRSAKLWARGSCSSSSSSSNVDDDIDINVNRAFLYCRKNYLMVKISVDSMFDIDSIVSNVLQ